MNQNSAAVIAVGVLVLAVIGVLFLADVQSKTMLDTQEKNGNVSFTVEPDGDYLVITFEDGAPGDVEKGVLLTPEDGNVKESVLPSQQTVSFDSNGPGAGTGIPEGEYQLIFLDENGDHVSDTRFTVSEEKPDWWPL